MVGLRTSRLDDIERPYSNVGIRYKRRLPTQLESLLLMRDYMRDFFPNNKLVGMRILKVWPFLFWLGSAEIVSLNDVPAPAPHSLVTAARFFIQAKYTGWNVFKRIGFWDPSTAGYPKIELKNAMFQNPQADPGHVDLVIMSYDSFWEKFVPFQDANRFCCTAEDVANKACAEENKLFLPTNVKKEALVVQIPISSNDTVKSPVQATYPVKRDGIYFLMAVNCNEHSLKEGHFTGSVIARSLNGVLSATDIPKIKVYAIGVLVYGIIVLGWGLCCLRYRQQLILLHSLIGLVIILSVIEQIQWYLHLSYANVFLPPSDTLLSLAILSSSVRNIATSVLILLTCLGLSITRPSLEASTKVKVWSGAIILLVLDLTRQIATHYHISLDLSMIILLISGLPTTILYTAGFMWSFHSLNSLLAELLARKQTAKHRQMSRYKSILMFAAICFTISTAVEAYVLTLDVRTIWPYEWIFTDAVPNALFSIILGVTALIWRPTRSSRYYSYNLQLPDSDLGDTIEIDRIRTDGTMRAFEIKFDNARGAGAETKNPEIRAWGDIDLELDEDESRPVAETRKQPTSNP